MDLFRVRLNCVDHYQATPTEFDPPLFGKHGSSQPKDAPQLPVIRVFGATETGQKVCAHIHGALPYLFVEYRGGLDKASVEDYTRRLRASIDHSLAVSYRRNLYDGKAIFVGHISLVKAVPFFGYHVGFKHFLKIYMLNPLNMTRFADLLYQGVIMGQVMQPFEAHLQYLLQWMCDFNLYGCSYIDCRKLMFREPIPQYLEMESTSHKWHDRSIPPHCISDPIKHPRQSHCSIEVDICVQDIVNRLELEERNIHSDFVERFIQTSPDEKLVNSLAGLWRDETLRRKRRMGIKDPSSSPFPPEVLISMSANLRDTKDGKWIHEDEFRDIIHSLIKTELPDAKIEPVTFDNFLDSVTAVDASVQTVSESVADLFPNSLANVSFSSQYDSQGTISVVNGDGLIPKLDSEDLPDSKESTPVPAVVPEDDIYAPPGDSFNGHLPGDSDLMEGEQNGLVGGEPRKRHLDIDDELQRPSKILLSSSQSKRQRNGHGHEDHTPVSSQQLSQSSIKAHSSQSGSVKGFKVVKSNDQLSASPKKSSANSNESNKVTLPSRQQSSLSNRSSGKTGKTSAVTSKRASPVSSQLRKVARLVNASATVLVFNQDSPRIPDMAGSLLAVGKPSVIYQDAYYSDEQDVPERARDYAGREFKLESMTTPYLPDFDATGESTASYGAKLPIVVDNLKQDLLHRRRKFRCKLRNWDYAVKPPSWDHVSSWLQEEAQQKEKMKKVQSRRKIAPKSRIDKLSQIEGPTQRNRYGFKFSQKRKTTSVQHETQYMSIMSLEVHVNTRNALVPDPEHDEVACIFWSLKDDGDEEDKDKSGIIALSAPNGQTGRIASEAGQEVEYQETELELINRIVDVVREYDPDVLTGYEVHNGSWGYLIERSRLKFEYNLCDELSRVKSSSHGRFGKDADRWGFNHTSTIRVTGRHMINIWRAMRSELNLLQYTMENVVFHLLHKRIPHYSFSDLTAWYKSGKQRDMAKCIEYFASRVRMNVEILEANELIPRTSEQARLIGVDFFSVFSRGSQFKVESFMFRIAKPENFILVSPSRKQVGSQNALECLPLVMEPQSNFYNSPLLVLDFQSLYPSIMIAYNLCYSTCLGRITNWRGTNKLGFSDYKRPPRMLELVKDYINIAPNGLMYVKPELRRSLLAKMLSEILETRVMVKSGMKVDKDDKTLQQLLNNRQLALKLLANVTYGYTSASFSGRMPCSEIADSIVQTARETLEKSIAFIHSVEKWGAEVVYGDTDSLFIYLKGRTKDEAFRIGEDIAREVTNRHPRPIKLKFEKVYYPCVLLAKKRYVGFKYESPTQKEPDFDAKGIETVRRDGTPAEQKIEEKALKILFRTADLSQVKDYFQRQCNKIMHGRVSVQDFCFAREVKLGTYADRGPPPPGALISTKRMLEDPRTEPQYGERVPYVVVSGAPGARLIDRCIAPEQLLKEEDLQLDAEYYISKNLIPPLERIFNLVGANVRQWYDEMPKIQRIRELNPGVATVPSYAPNGALMPVKKTLESYMKSSMCVVCRTKLPPPQPGESNHAVVPLCQSCRDDVSGSLYTLRSRQLDAEEKQSQLERICRNCSGFAHAETVQCDSKDCPVFYSRTRARAKGKRVKAVVEAISLVLEKDSLAW